MTKKDKEHIWLESDYELLFNALSNIIYNQQQIQKGIIALAKKEGMEISFKDENFKITKDYFKESKDD